MAMNKTKTDMTKVGALFSKESQKGKTYFTGFLESGTKLVAFVNAEAINKETGDAVTVINIYEQQELEAIDGVKPIVKKKAVKKKLPF